MSRSKTFALGTAVITGAFAASVALSGSASAGGPATATYSCQSVTPLPGGGTNIQNFPSVSAQFSTSTAGLKMIASLAPGITIAPNTITSSINLVSGAAPGTVTPVTYSGTANLPSGISGPVNVGPVPLTSGTASAALHTITSTSAPSSTNFSVKLKHNPTNTDIYCVATSDFNVVLNP
jgi:hypothetical protein